MHQRVLSQMALRPSFMLGLLFSGAGGDTIQPGIKPPRFSSLSVARKRLTQPNPLGFFSPACWLCWCWLHSGYTVQNPVLLATQWLHRHKRERVHY